MRVCVCVPGPKSNNAYDHFQNVLDGFGAVASLEGKVEDRVRLLYIYYLCNDDIPPEKLASMEAALTAPSLALGFLTLRSLSAIRNRCRAGPPPLECPGFLRAQTAPHVRFNVGLPANLLAMPEHIFIGAAESKSA